MKVKSFDEAKATAKRECKPAISGFATCITGRTIRFVCSCHHAHRVHVLAPTHERARRPTASRVRSNRSSSSHRGTHPHTPLSSQPTQRALGVPWRE
jgi:hypothetical protein